MASKTAYSRPKPKRPGYGNLNAPWAVGTPAQQAAIAANVQGAIAAAQPGAPAPINGPLDFLSGQEQVEYGGREGEFNKTISDLLYGLEQQRIQAAYSQTQLAKQSKVSAAQSNASAAARGVFHSSIRANDLSDIKATAALKSQFLQDQLGSAESNYLTQKANAENAWGTVQGGFRKIQATEAANAGANVQPPGFTPTPIPGSPSGGGPSAPTGVTVTPAPSNTPSVSVTARPQGFANWTQKRKAHWFANHPGY